MRAGRYFERREASLLQQTDTYGSAVAVAATVMHQLGCPGDLIMARSQVVNDDFLAARHVVRPPLRGPTNLRDHLPLPACSPLAKSGGCAAVECHYRSGLPRPPVAPPAGDPNRPGTSDPGEFTPSHAGLGNVAYRIDDFSIAELRKKNKVAGVAELLVDECEDYHR